MELQQINKRIAVVNGESKRLNNERQVLIGKRQTLEKQLSDLLSAYKNDYGVELTIDTIGAEVERVAKLKEEEVSAVETMLALIREGRYDEAEKMASGVVVSSQGVVQEVDTSEASTEEFDQEPEPDPAAPPTFAPPAPEPAPAASPTFAPPVSTAEPVEPSVPAAPPTFAPPASPPAPPVAPPTGDRPAPPPPISKPKAPLGAPKLGAAPTVDSAPQPGALSFQAVLSGKAFNPQEGG